MPRPAKDAGTAMTEARRHAYEHRQWQSQGRHSCYQPRSNTQIWIRAVQPQPYDFRSCTVWRGDFAGLATASTTQCSVEDRSMWHSIPGCTRGILPQLPRASKKQEVYLLRATERVTLFGNQTWWHPLMQLCIARYCSCWDENQQIFNLNLAYEYVW